MTTLSMTATSEMRGERLDRALARHFGDLSRARLQALIREGAARLGERRITDPSLKLRGGETWLHKAGEIVDDRTETAAGAEVIRPEGDA